MRGMKLLCIWISQERLGVGGLGWPGRLGVFLILDFALELELVLNLALPMALVLVLHLAVSLVLRLELVLVLRLELVL